LKQHGLSSRERIKSKKTFNDLFTTGKVLISKDQKIKAVYLVDKKAEEAGVKIGAAVSKKHGKAVWRNRVKRLIRISYRLNKEKLIAFCKKKSILLKIVFSTVLLTEETKKKVRLKDIMPDVIELMRRIESSYK
jgi:ribonuclease P protein component